MLTMEEYKEELKRRLKDIKENPHNHRHTFQGLSACCTIGGIFDVQLMEAHEGLVPQRNPGGCDVVSGPCSCGAWH